MCYKHPGPRCSAHTEPVWDAAKAELVEARQSGDNERIAKARKGEQTARQEYFTTPKGQQYLLRQAEKYEESGNTEAAEKIRDMADKMLDIRKGHIDTLKKIVNAERGRPGASMPPVGIISRQFSHKSRQYAKQPPQRNGSPSSTRGYGIAFNHHTMKQADLKGFTEQDMVQTFANPERIYPNGRYPDQHRITGNGLCLVGKFEGDTFKVVTVYLDGVVTKPREDQLKTNEGRDFHQRFQRFGSQSRDGVRARTA